MLSLRRIATTQRLTGTPHAVTAAGTAMNGEAMV
jgi:hypothetical protein